MTGGPDDGGKASRCSPEGIKGWHDRVRRRRNRLHRPEYIDYQPHSKATPIRLSMRQTT
jgi:hypothetical protein